MAQYQTFPDAEGASRTADKLAGLMLPELQDRSFLDVGCNEGFFCGFARFSGASRVVGIDKSPLFIGRARQRFPDCEFVVQGWETLPEGSFDVILLASALHYADDQPALIARLVDHLSPDGVLILEIGIVSSQESQWVEVDRGIDRRQFPTMRKLREVLDGYAWKWMGPSVMQQGDPIPRHVVHVTRRKPVAYLLMQPPGYGKTSIATRLFLPAGVDLQSGDEHLNRIAKGQLRVDAALERVVKDDFSPFRIDQVVRQVFESEAGRHLADACVDHANGRDFALDMFVPAEHQPAFESAFASRGYLPVRLAWDRFGPPLMASERVSGLALGFCEAMEPAGLPPLHARPPTQGFVDELSMEDGKLVVRGWAIDPGGALPSTFTVRLNGRDLGVDRFESEPRPDVMSHLGTPHAHFGYRLRLEVPGLSRVDEVGPDFSVLAADGVCLQLNERVRKRLDAAAMTADGSLD